MSPSRRSQRVTTQGNEVKAYWHMAQHNDFPTDDDAWVDVLRRPPETWSTAEVAHWAQRPRSECGGQLGDLVSRRLWENAIDGQLLLLHVRGGQARPSLGLGVSNALGISDPAQRQAVAEAIEELRTLQDRILYGDVVLPPPRELMQQLAPPLATAPGGTGGRLRSLPRKRTDPKAGTGAGDAVTRTWQAYRPVGLSGTERILLNAKMQAAAAAAAAGTAARGGAAASRQGDGGEGTPAAGAGSGMRLPDDVGQLSDQGRGRPGGGAEAQAGAGMAGAGRGSGGEVHSGEVLGGLRRMVELVEAHDDVVRRLQVLRVRGPRGLARFQQERKRAAEEAVAAAAAEAAAAQAAAAAAAAPSPPPVLTLEEVEERGRTIRQRAAAQAADVDELARVPLRRGMRRAAARAEAQAAGAAAAAAEGDGDGAASGDGDTRGSGSEGFSGVGAARVLRGGWREVDEDGADVGEGSVRQSLGTAGRALLEDADRRKAAVSYPEPWVYDDDGGGGGSEDGVVERGRGARVGEARRAAGNGARGGPGARGVGPAEDDNDDKAERRRRRVQREVRARPWAVPDLRVGSDRGGGGAARRRDSERLGADGAPAAASAEPRRPASARREPGGAGGGGGGGAANSGPVLRPLVGLPRGRGREPGSWDVHPPRPAADPWLTADQEAVRRVLETGASTPVHHTLKSKLACDTVRYMYGITPRSAAAPSDPRRSKRRPVSAGPGPLAEAAAAVAVPFFPPASLLNDERAAVHEVDLRRQLGVPVSLDLLAARSLAVSRERRRVLQVVPQRRTAPRPVDPEAAPSESEPHNVLTEAVQEEDGSISFASRYGFQVAPSPNAPAAATHHHHQPASSSPPSSTPPLAVPAAAARPQSRFAQDAAQHPRGQGHQGQRQQQQLLQDQGREPLHHNRPQQGRPHAPNPRLDHLAAPASVTATVPTAAVTARPQRAAQHVIPNGPVRQRPASAAAASAMPFTELTEISTGAFPVATVWQSQEAKEEHLLEQGNVFSFQTQGHGHGHAYQLEPEHGSDPTSLGAQHARGSTAAEREPAATGRLPRGRLPPPEARVRGIGRDGELLKAIAARVAAGGAAAAVVAADAVEGGGGGSRGGGRLNVTRPTSAARARGMVRIGDCLAGQWGDPELQRRLRQTLRMLNGDEAAEEVGVTEGRAYGSGGQRRHSDGSVGGAQRRQPGPGEWAAQIYRFKGGEMVYTGRRPPFSTKPEPQYEVPGMQPRPLGQSWTKRDAERLAGAISADVRGNTELHWAANRGDAARVGELLEAAGGPQERAALANKRNQSGETPLHRAAMCQGPRAVAAMEYLLAAGADTDPRDVNGATPLMCILTSDRWMPEGDRRARTLLAAGARLDICDSSGETLLHKAIIHTVCRGSEVVHRHSSLADLLELLLAVAREQRSTSQWGAVTGDGGAGEGPLRTDRPDPFRPGGLGSGSDPSRQPVSSAARGDVRLQASVAVSGSRPGSGGRRTGGDFTRAHPLAAAAAAGTSGTLAATMVAAAAAAAAAGGSGGRPAAGHLRPSAPAPLSVDARDALGRTPLHVACSRPHLHAPGMVGCCVAVLLREGADPDAVDGSGRRPLHWVLSEAVEAVRLREANRINHTKLATARPKQPPGAMCWVAEKLLRAGADPNAPDEATGYTPLHLAALARSRPLLRLLLRLGADPRVRDRAGATAGDALRAALRTARDREEARNCESLVQEIQKCEQAIEAAASKVGVSAVAAATAAGGFGSLGMWRWARSGARRESDRRSDKPGLGGGTGPTTLRRLYRERFGLDSSEEVEEQEEGPTQQELVQAYMAAMRAGRLGAAPSAPGPTWGGTQFPATTTTVLATTTGATGAATAPHHDGARTFAAAADGAAIRAAVPMDPELAATKIQAAFRGHRTRDQLRKAGVPIARHSARQAASSTITPRVLPYGPEHERAAVKIQAAYRGHKVRARYGQRRGTAAAAAQPPAPQQQRRGTVTAGRAAGAVPTPPQPDVLGPDGRPYGPAHVQAATRIQASWKGHKARKLYNRVRYATAEEYDADLGLDEDEIQALARSASRGQRAHGRSPRSTRGPEAGGDINGAAASGVDGGNVGGGGDVPAPEPTSGDGRLGSNRATRFGSEGGASDNIANSVGGWSVTSAALSQGAESFQAPEAPPLRPWYPLTHGAASASFGRATADDGDGGGGRGPLDRSNTSASLSFRQRDGGSRRTLVVPQVSLTQDGRLLGDVDDLDLLDLEDDDEDGNLLEDDGRLPSGIALQEGAPDGGDDADDGDGVF